MNSPNSGDVIFLKLGLLEIRAFGDVAIAAVVFLAVLVVIARIFSKRSKGQ
jgi:hypothetical protein